MFGFLTTKAQPIEIKNTVEIKVTTNADFIRNISRLVRLYQCVSSGDDRLEVREEINTRKMLCRNFGHAVPETLQEAEALLEKVILNAN